MRGRLLLPFGLVVGDARAGHVGMRLLEDVAASVGARLEVSSEPGAGTTVRMELAP